ncbi:hypothetical protein BKH46_05080 [Helicobacter sp. 12S02634-8]|uniref:hypothetical protein n=1 Tax=Helicobacter sp. 12S02634-8 TaxID=1476199 RepID=UPI000BA5E34F|nr:hypothetical protein [Helicobacter sp. 12S02634-8]PAF47093.1 hypothetical protein BKH46_05080 [Helicobacter sp. 12S02634-8]
MTLGLKRSNKVVFMTQDGCIDTHLRPITPSKNSKLLSCIPLSHLIKGQIRAPKHTLPADGVDTKDWLYVRCLEMGIFEANLPYVFVYLCEDSPSESVFHIYALLATSINPHQVCIPDVFLPMVLESTLREAHLFLLGETLVFYHQGKLAYTALCQDFDGIINALDYIHTIYSISPIAIYGEDTSYPELPVPFIPLSTLVARSPQPIATLSFLYFAHKTPKALPLLVLKPAFSFYQSHTSKLLLLIACVTLLMLIYPMIELSESLYIKHQTQKLIDQNLAISHQIQSLKTAYKATAPQSLKPITQKDLLAIHQAQTSYIPRYALIAKLTQILKSYHIQLKDLYVSGDIWGNAVVIGLEISSDSSENLTTAITKLKTSLPQAKSTQIFSHTLDAQPPRAQIIWTYNVL